MTCIERGNLTSSTYDGGKCIACFEAPGPRRPLSFRDQCVLALLSNSGVGRLPMGQGDEVEIFDMADRMQAERTRREGQ